MIVLVGYMGSGKSTLGKELAKQLRIHFIDLDEIIEEKIGKNIPQIFDIYGEYFFRKQEYLVLKKELEKRERRVIATGGGTPIFYNSMELINQFSQSIYIKVPVEELISRLKNETATRPILRNKTRDELKNFIESHLDERETFYKTANYIINYNSIDEAIAEIKTKFT